MNNKNTVKAGCHNLLAFAVASLALASFTATATNIYSDITKIESNTLNNVTGTISINMAAGDHNIQSNNKSLAMGENALSTLTNSASTANLENTSLISDAAKSVRIEAHTLHNAKGLISINQVAGASNIQINDIGIALGNNAQVISDLSLSTHATYNPEPLSLEDNKNSIYIDKDSLKGAQGVIQISQIAGNSNIVVNRVSMPIQ
ncbi:hypothetical protein [Oceanisphaera avium]|uniref:Adhesin n=1 Tax=Oceanisphaera avium TaxID=1903694 RepID=A0A1Y0CYA5_9GAMM|nr:hypothetical protein [Oceanisphaera avium]ART80281.1 hypothetical protein CBP12_09085 [Oceanisphaera avium]